jgi:elongation factor 1-alpha
LTFFHLEQIEEEARRLNKSSYAAITDKSERDNSRITIDTKPKKFDSTKYTCLIEPLDSINNMITDTSQADVAMLVVSSAKGEFEAGISEQGQTREHALLAYTLGIKQMLVLINKMDSNYHQLQPRALRRGQARDLCPT